MCYNVSAKHQIAVDKNYKRMREIEKEFPENYFVNEEWRKLNGENSWHLHAIKDYKRKIAMGIKF